jgi:amino acid transporter
LGAEKRQSCDTSHALTSLVPVSLGIILLPAIVYFSYRQTIAAYPGGGGSYTVATENLGTYSGLLAAAALMLDYVLVVAVGISAGVGRWSRLHDSD